MRMDDYRRRRAAVLERQRLRSALRKENVAVAIASKILRRDTSTKIACGTPAPPNDASYSEARGRRSNRSNFCGMSGTGCEFTVQCLAARRDSQQNRPHPAHTAIHRDSENSRAAG